MLRFSVVSHSLTNPSSFLEQTCFCSILLRFTGRLGTIQELCGEGAMPQGGAEKIFSTTTGRGRWRSGCVLQVSMQVSLMNRVGNRRSLVLSRGLVGSGASGMS